MRRNKIVEAILVFMLLIIAGCGNKSDKVQGIWKDTKGKDLIHTDFIEIGKDYFIVDGKREDGIVLVDIDGVVMMQTAGTRKDVMRLILHEDDTLTIEMPLVGKQKFTRTSKEELEAKEKAIAEAKEIVRKKIAAVSGVWKDKNAKSLIETEFLEIQQGFMVINGKRIGDITLKTNTENNQVAVDRGVMYGITMKLTPKDSNSIIVHLRSSGDKEFVKSSHNEIKAKEKAIADAEEAARKKAEAERIAREKKIAAIQGVWKDKKDSDLITTDFFDIGKDYLVINKERAEKVKYEANNEDDVVNIKAGYGFGGYNGINVTLSAENTLVFYKGTKKEIILYKSTAEEMAAKEKAIAEKYNQLIKDSRGTWVKYVDEKSYGNALESRYQAVVITNDSLTVNNETLPINYVELSKDSSHDMPYYPAVGYAESPNSFFFGIQGFENNNNVMVTFRNNWSKDITKYLKTTAENISLHDNPSLENIKGGWIKEGKSDEGYNVIAFSKDVYYCDGQSIKIIAKPKNHSPRLLVERGSSNKEDLLSVVQFDPNTIRVRYYNGKIWHTYHRMSNSEAKKQMAKYPDKIKVLQGYWRSVEPIRDDIYKYYAIFINHKKGKEFIDKVLSLDANKDKSSWVSEGTGYFGYKAGKINESMWLLKWSSAYYPGIKVLDKNTIECETDSDNSGVKFKRVTKAELPERLIKKIDKK